VIDVPRAMCRGCERGTSDAIVFVLLPYRVIAVSPGRLGGLAAPRQQLAFPGRLRQPQPRCDPARQVFRCRSACVKAKAKPQFEILGLSQRRRHSKDYAHTSHRHVQMECAALHHQIMWKVSPSLEVASGEWRQP
jgi:hypothetical protein